MFHMGLGVGQSASSVALLPHFSSLWLDLTGALVCVASSVAKLAGLERARACVAHPLAAEFNDLVCRPTNNLTRMWGNSLAGIAIWLGSLEAWF